MKKNWGRAISWLMVFAMIVTLLPVSSKLTKAADAQMNVTLHFDNLTANYDEVWMQYWGGSPTLSNSAGSTYLSSWGVNIYELTEEDDDWWSITVNGSVEGFQFLNSDGSKYTGSVYNSAMAQYIGDEPADLYYSGGNWYTDADCTTELEEVEAADVFVVVGDIVSDGWSLDSEAYLTQVGDTDYYSITLENVEPGDYSFKILQDPDNYSWEKAWDDGTGSNQTLHLTAPANVTLTIDSSEVGSAIEVTLDYIECLIVADKQVEKGSCVTLDSTGTLYDTDGAGTVTDLIYTLNENDDAVTLDGYELSVAEDFDGTEVDLTASPAAISVSGSSITAQVKVSVVENEYTFTIYYYNQYIDMQAGASDIYIFNKEGSENAVVSLDETYEDEDNGITWVKGSVTLPYGSLGIIGRPTAGSWSGQDGNQYYTLTEGKTATLWYVHGDGIYTEKPTVTLEENRYVALEYVRADGDYEGWNIYTWNSGFGSEVTVDFEETESGSYVALIPIMPTVSSLSFCVRKTVGDDAWGLKDGGDHAITTPTNQTVIRAVMTAGEEPELQYPYNTGYEIDTDNNVVNFYYRDDTAYLEDTLADLGSVVLYHDGTTTDMTFDEDNQRYCVSLPLTIGEHYYYYLVNGEKVLDQFNENEGTYEGEDCSTYSYEKFEGSVTASISPSTIDYNDNAVLSVGISGDDIEDMEIEEAYADLTALGGETRVDIDTNLMELSIGVRDNISAGTKEIPVTLVDQYSNKYTATATVKVVKRNAAGDFDWDESIIYFMVTDRFMDGNSSNNTANGEETYGDNDGLYHGGDFAGVTQKLDYLQDLGINTIWITPIVDNIEGVEVGSDVEGSSDVPYNAAYHGYWADNFQQLNPSLGTEDELRTLISEAHDRGIKIMVDIVLNHAGYGTEDIFGDMLRSDEDTVSGDEILDSLSGLPDFATEKQEVREKLIEWQTAWVEGFGIDYFRVDTVKHVDKTTWSELKNELTKINPDFKMIGEYSGAGYANNYGYLESGTMDSLLDFDFNDTAQSFVTGDLESMETFLEKRNAAINNVGTLGSFLSSHDEDGLLYKLEESYDEEEAKAKMMVAAALQITSKGQPVIYYGEEIGLTGANDYPYQTNRYDFDWSLVNDENTMLNHYKALLAARNEYSAVFAKGDRTELAGSDEDGYMVFNRSYNSQNVTVGLNITDEAKEVTLTLSFAKKYYVKDVYSGTTYKTDSNGKVTVTIPAAEDGGCIILAPVKKISASSSGSSSSSSSSGSSSTSGTESANGTVTGGNVNISIGFTAKIRLQDKKAIVDLSIPTADLLNLASQLAGEDKLQVSIPLPSDTLIDYLKNGGAESGNINITLDSELLSNDKITIGAINVPKELIEALKTLGKVVTVTVADESGKVLYQFELNGAAYSQYSQEARDLNIALSLDKITDTKEIYELLKDYKKGSTGLVLSFGEEDKLPEGTSLKVKVGEALSLKEGERVYLYRYNPDTKKLEVVTSSSYLVDKDGFIAVNPLYGGDYVILPCPAGTKVKTTLDNQIKLYSRAVLSTGESRTMTVRTSDIITRVTDFGTKALQAVSPARVPVTISFKSSDGIVAAVDGATGALTAKKKGKTVITTTVTFQDGSKKTYKTTITVK